MPDHTLTLDQLTEATHQLAGRLDDLAGRVDAQSKDLHVLRQKTTPRIDELNDNRLKMADWIREIEERVGELADVSDALVAGVRAVRERLATAENHAPTPPPAPAPAQDAPEMFFDPTADEIGRWAKRRRQLRGMTLRDVSDATGIAYSHIAKFENGGSNISADYLFAICKAVGGAAGLMLPGYAAPIPPPDPAPGVAASVSAGVQRYLDKHVPAPDEAATVGVVSIHVYPEFIRLVREILRTTQHSQEIVRRIVDKAIALGLAAPISPPATAPDPAPDEAAKWEDVARINYDWTWEAGDKDWEDFGIKSDFVDHVQSIVAKAIALGLAAPADPPSAQVRRMAVTIDCLKDLAGETVEWEAVSDAMQHLAQADRDLINAIPADGYRETRKWIKDAPADRVVCAVTDKLVNEARNSANRWVVSAEHTRRILEYAAAYWNAGADTPGEKP